MKKIVCTVAAAAVICSVWLGGMQSGMLTDFSAASKTKTVSTTTVNIIKGQKKTLKASKLKGKIKWKSSKKRVVKVSKKGKITAKRKGTAVITARAGRKQMKFKVRVCTPKLSQKTASVKTGKTVTLKLKGINEKVTWSSSNASVATVSSAGVVKGVKAGTASVTAKVLGKKYVCKVTVTKAASTSAPAETGKPATDTGKPAGDSGKTDNTGKTGESGTGKTDDKQDTTKPSTPAKDTDKTEPAQEEKETECQHDMQPVYKKVLVTPAKDETVYPDEAVYQECQGCKARFFVYYMKDLPNMSTDDIDEANRKALDAFGKHSDEAVQGVFEIYQAEVNRVAATYPSYADFRTADKEGKITDEKYLAAVKAYNAEIDKHMFYHSITVKGEPKIVHHDAVYKQEITGYKCSKCGYTSKTKN